jgi:hypothetical protein
VSDHTHEHPGREHGHDHDGHGPHVHERYADRVHAEFVVLEIGEGLGALIVHTDPEMHGVEIEISPAGQDHARQHKDVLERPLGGQARFSAVFDQIPEGTYTLWVRGEARACDVQITDSAVGELDWRTAPHAA